MGGAPYVRIRGIPITLMVLIQMHRKLNVVTHAQEIQHGANTKTPRKHTLPKSAVCTVPYTCTQPITQAMVATRKQNQSKFIAEYHARASGATQLRQIWLPVHPRNFVIHVTVRPTDRPPACLSVPQGKQCEILHFLASMEAFNLILHIYVVDSF